MLKSVNYLQLLHFKATGQKVIYRSLQNGRPRLSQREWKKCGSSSSTVLLSHGCKVLFKKIEKPGPRSIKPQSLVVRSEDEKLEGETKAPYVLSQVQPKLGTTDLEKRYRHTEFPNWLSAPKTK